MTTPHNATAYPEEHLYIDTPAETAAEQEAVYQAQQAAFSGHLPVVQHQYQYLTGQGPLVDPPEITSISPTTQVGGSMLTLVVNGSGFTAASKVSFDGILETPDGATTTTTRLLCWPPFPAAGTVKDVPVFVDNGGGSVSDTVTFQWVAAEEDPEATTTKKKASKK